MAEFITLSLQELITSGCLSQSIFLFDDEAIGSETSGSFKLDESIDDELCHLNAAKVSFFLAKFSSRYYSVGAIQLLQSSNIFIQLKCCSELDVRCCLDSSPDLPVSTAEDKEPTIINETDRVLHEISDMSTTAGHEHPLRVQHSPSSSSASSFGEIVSDDDKANEKRVHEDDNKNINFNAHNSEPTDITSSIMGSEGGDSDADIKTCGSEGIIRVPISDVGQFHSIVQANTCKLYCTLVDVGTTCVPSNSGSTSQFNEVISSVAAIDIIGNLIHFIFSGGKQLLPCMYQASGVAPELSGEDTLNEVGDTRRSKQRRNKDKSLFSSLVESGGNYPISICRLISDMVGAGPGGKADAPFASFDEVINDLKQMSLHPEIFLHDPDASFSSPSLLFGQRYYGREDEVTKILKISTRLEQSAGGGESLVETIFIGGIAGSGKTHLARRVGNFLSSLGWLVLEAKFDRCSEHESRGVIILLIEKLISKLIDMKKGSNEKDIEYSKRAAKAISDAFDAESISALADFIPNIHNLIESIDKGIDRNKSPGGGGTSQWHLVYLVSTLLSAVLSLDRFIMICLDDLQWCDSMMLELIKETIIVIAHHNQERQHLLFVGTYRHNEVGCDHPLTSQLANLQRHSSVGVTQIHLSSLSINDISDMLMTEMRIPKRLVVDLACTLQKKCHGHAIFVVELLNSMLRNSTIAYSPQKRRYDWESSKVSSIKTGNDVASLIISELTLFQPDIIWALCVLSCFGIKTEVSLLHLLQGSSLLPSSGFDLVSLVEGGFVELSGSTVVFSHDLIQQYVYEKMPVHQRQKLHLDIGTSLATKTALDSSLLAYKHIEAGMEQLFIYDGGNGDDDNSSISILTLAGIATSQINKAGPEFISDRSQRMRFAGWNMRAANESAGKSNFRASLYYCKSGISFLGDKPWVNETCQLSLELHEGAAFASFAVAHAEEGLQYTNAIISADTVEFEQTLVAQNMLIQSLEARGLFAETIARGLAVLRRLGFDIPLAPSPQNVMQSMTQTSNIASQYNFDHISNLSQVICPKQKHILRIIDSVAVACFRSTSPYLPLVACATVLYAFQHGIYHCEESASAFVIFGYFKVYLEGKLDAGQPWGNLAVSLLSKSGGKASVRARMYLFGFLYFWYIPIKDTVSRLYETYTIGIRCGDVDSAMHALSLGWGYQFYGGEKLSIVNANYEECMALITKYNQVTLAQQTLLSKIVLNELIGLTDDNPFSVLHGKICNLTELLGYAKSNNDIQLIESAHRSRFFSAFWMGDLHQAMKVSKTILSLASSKMPKFQISLFTAYRGIVAYRLFREGNGTDYFTVGNEVLSKIQSWLPTCNWMENKVLLLKAECFASQCNRSSAIENYEASIKSACDLSFVHEQGLAYECMGEYLSSIFELPEAERCYLRAHECYMQWGAYGKAALIRSDHGLDPNNHNDDQSSSKHGRDVADMTGSC